MAFARAVVQLQWRCFRHRNPIGYGAVHATKSAPPPTTAGIRVAFVRRDRPLFLISFAWAYWITVCHRVFFCRIVKEFAPTRRIRPCNTVSSRSVTFTSADFASSLRTRASREFAFGDRACAEKRKLHPSLRFCRVLRRETC